MFQSIVELNILNVGNRLYNQKKVPPNEQFINALCSVVVIAVYQYLVVVSLCSKIGYVASLCA